MVNYKTLKIDPDVHKQLRIFCAEKDIYPVSEGIRELFRIKEKVELKK